MKKGMADTR